MSEAPSPEAPSSDKPTPSNDPMQVVGERLAGIERQLSLLTEAVIRNGGIVDDAAVHLFQTIDQSSRRVASGLDVASADSRAVFAQSAAQTRRTFRRCALLLAATYTAVTLYPEETKDLIHRGVTFVQGHAPTFSSSLPGRTATSAASGPTPLELEVCRTIPPRRVVIDRLYKAPSGNVFTPLQVDIDRLRRGITVTGLLETPKSPDGSTLSYNAWQCQPNRIPVKQNGGPN